MTCRSLMPGAGAHHSQGCSVCRGSQAHESQRRLHAPLQNPAASVSIMPEMWPMQVSTGRHTQPLMSQRKQRWLQAETLISRLPKQGEYTPTHSITLYRIICLKTKARVCQEKYLFHDHALVQVSSSCSAVSWRVYLSPADLHLHKSLLIKDLIIYSSWLGLSRTLPVDTTVPPPLWHVLGYLPDVLK